ncbi:MAG: GNAT family N-acetyltransferase [Fimbriimonadaceae bacterium]|nr:GNAT family N-acetyltransferase [Fimbriimonadaceae bacterium]
MRPTIGVVPLRDPARAWANDLLAHRWGGPRIERLGELIDASTLPAFVALLEDERVGLVTYQIRPDELEVVTLDSLVPGCGIGSALLHAVEGVARSSGSRRVFLYTTNDNLPAMRFYQRRGYRFVRVFHDAMTKARELKASIPAIGLQGIPLLDEIEFAKSLD